MSGAREAVIVGREMVGDVPVVVVSCPFCGRQHRHRAPGGDDHGIRRSPCMNGPYQLIEGVA